MFESLQDRMDRAFKTLKGQGRISEINVAATMKEIRRALVEADVNYKIAKDFTARVQEKAMGESVLTAISPGQLLTKIVKDELAVLMGGESQEINIEGKPAVILIAGLQGSGKTTFTAKLATFLKAKKSKKPLLIACDVYRPAAIDQLHVLAEQIKVDVFSDKESNDPADIAKRGIEHAKEYGHNLVIVDTAGRLAVDEEMMDEIGRLKDITKPQEILFVVDSMTGQDAVNTAAAFNEKLDFNGVVLTKLDGDTRGGAALSIAFVVGKPIKFMSTGEKMESIDVFHPDRMAQRILGMGDVISLVERAQEQFDEEQAKKLQRKIQKNKFDFNDFLSQIAQIKKMGNVKDLLAMVPGAGKMLKDVDIDDDAFKKIEAIIYSMTPYERENPQILNGTRRKRVALGSGNTIQEVNSFIKQFDEMRKMMKTMTKMNSAGRSLKGMPFMRRK